MWARIAKMYLRDDDRKKKKAFISETEFKSGDGKVVASEKSVVIPCNIGGKNVSIKKDEVKSEIPLLLRKESMKAAESKIDFVNDRICLVKIFTYTLQLVGITLCKYELRFMSN